MKKAFSFLILVMIIINLYANNINVFSYEYMDPNNELGVYQTKQDIYDITEEYYEIFEKKKDSSGIMSYNNKYWWPIGSAETIEENGVLFAKGDPETVHISSYFGNRTIDGVPGNHGAIDIDCVRIGETNVIAAKSGVVTYPTSDDLTHFPTGSLGNNDGSGFGNFVVIQHSNGDTTIYAHLYQDTITVRAGDTVSQGQVIGKTGSSGNSSGPHLHFEIRIGGSPVDPLQYISAEDPRPAASGGGNFSVTTTSLTETEYVSLIESYASSHQSDFWSLYSSNASLIYEIAAEEGVNPELVVVTAVIESGSGSHLCGKNNYWGIGCTNRGGSSSFSSFEEGVRAYCGLLKSYMSGSDANRINARAQEREAAGCNPAGYGTPDTLSGQQSVYSWIGDYRYNPGNSGIGGCYYLNHWMYEDNYCSTVPTCTDYNNCPEDSRTTVCEQNDYTIYQVNQKIQIRQNIFGI